MTRCRGVVSIRRAIAMTVVVAIVLVLFSSPVVIAEAVDVPPCCHTDVERLVEVDEPPCCASSDLGGCCFIVCLPPMCQLLFVPSVVSEAVLGQQFHCRGCCSFIFEPPKM